MTADNIDRLDDLLDTEIFSNYKDSFYSSKEIKDLRSKNYFKEKSEDDRAVLINNRFIEYLYDIEKRSCFISCLLIKVVKKYSSLEALRGKKNSRRL